MTALQIQKRKILFALLPVAVIILWLMLSTVARMTEVRGHSSLSSNPKGTRALYLFLQEAGFEVTRVAGRGDLVQQSGACITFLEPPPQKSKNQLLVVQNDGFEKAQLADLESRLDWVKKGNSWVVVGVKFPKGLGIDVKPLDKGPWILEPASEDVPIPAESLFAGKAFEMEVRSAKTKKEKTQTGIQIPSKKDKKYIPKDFTLSLHPMFAAKGNAKPSIAYQKHGKGKLVYITCPGVGLNAGLRHGKDVNAVFWYHLVDWLGGKKVMFDESSRMTGMDPGIAGYLKHRKLMPLVIGFVILLFLAAWTAAGRLAAPQVTAEAITVDARQSAEYVQALGRLYQRSGQHKRLLKKIMEEHYRVLMKTFFLRKKVKLEELIAIVKIRIGEKDSILLEKHLVQGSQLLKKKVIVDEHFAHWCRNAVNWEKFVAEAVRKEKRLTKESNAK